ncbi:MAG: tetratricopeptide repeat protein, partial [Brevundimonas sp.]
AIRLATEAPEDLSVAEAAWKGGEPQAAIDYAKGLAGHGRLEQAIEVLLGSIKADREWNNGAARALLLEVFDAAGQGSDITRAGRKKLSSILFS